MLIYFNVHWRRLRVVLFRGTIFLLFLEFAFHASRKTNEVFMIFKFIRKVIQNLISENGVLLSIRKFIITNI